MAALVQLLSDVWERPFPEGLPEAVMPARVLRLGLGPGALRRAAVWDCRPSGTAGEHTADAAALSWFANSTRRLLKRLQTNALNQQPAYTTMGP